MPFILLLALLLTGCSQSSEAQMSRTLSEYASAVRDSSTLSLILTGSALKSAEATKKLMLDLELTQRGVARFEVDRTDDKTLFGCLDLSEVRIYDRAGKSVSSRERNRIWFSANFTNDFLIRELRVEDKPC
jgi:hypothetical protein